MGDFLRYAATEIYREHGEHVKDLLILFPSHRNVLFFRRALAGTADKPVWAPHLHTLDSLVKQESGAAIPDELSMVMHLHTSWKALGNDEPFEQFYTLGRQIISDFDLLDRALTDTDHCFDLLSAFHTDEPEWPEDAGEELRQMVGRLRQTEGAFNLGKTWGNLGKLYRHFHQNLENHGLSTSGWVFRNMAQQRQKAPANPYLAIYAVGFYQLSKAEQKILGGFGNVRYIWNMLNPDDAQILDTDSPLQNFTEQVKVRSSFFRPEQRKKHIEITSASGLHVQYQGLSSVLQQIPEHEQSETCILVPGQGLLLPLLQVIPESVKKVNVSMGLSVVDTSVFALIRRFIRIADEWKANGIIARRWLTDFFSHHLTEGNSSVDELLASTNKNLYLEHDRHWKAMPEPWHSLLLPCNNQFDLLDRCLELIKIIYPKTKDEAESAAAYTLFTRLKRFKEVLAGYGETWTPAFFLSFLQRILQESRVNLKGEPLEGVQILGLFEMANLHFKHLVVIQASDGVLPVVSFQSLLPFTLRSWYKLPGIDEQVKVQEFLFWQLISQADNVHLFYNENHDGLGGAEPSRWVRRMKLGMVPEHWQINERGLQFKRPVEPAHWISWTSGAGFSEKMRERLATSVSYSGINTWLTCRLKYALHYVHGLKEDDEPTADIQANDIGNIVHRVMDLLYKNYTDVEITLNMEVLIRQKAREIFREVYPEVLNIPPALQHTGQHLFFTRALWGLISKMLDHDFKRTPYKVFVPVSMEQNLEHEFNWEETPVRFKGYIDRLDRTGHSLRIIDYKTGNVNEQSLSRGNTENIMLTDGKNNQYALQTLFYVWLYQRCKQTTEIPEVHIYPARGIVAGNTHVAINNQYAISQDFIEDFEEQLFNQLSMMLDPGVEIAQTPNRSACKYCPYRVMCGR